MAEKLLIPVYLPSWLHSQVVRAKRALIPPKPVAEIPSRSRINILGERNVEWAFLSTEMPTGPGDAFEFGCEQGYMSLLAAHKGFNVIANDLQEQPFTWKNPNVRFVAGDFTKLDIQENQFDLAINCSSVEHVGVAGRYGITVEENDGDLEVMRRLARIIKPTGILIMTAPCGRDAVMAPWCRVYGPKRLPRLLEPFRIEKQSYWMKDAFNQWIPCDRAAALSFEPIFDPNDAHGCAYALGAFVLKPLKSA